MEIHEYFTAYGQLLDSILLHQDLAPFGISTESERSDDHKNLDQLFENKDSIKGKLRGLPDNSADARDFLIKLKAISEKTSQIIHTIKGFGNISGELELTLFFLHHFWAEGTQFAGLQKPGTATLQEAENNTTNDKSKRRCNGLAEALKEYIDGATDDKLDKAINKKTERPDLRPMVWKGSKFNAMRFAIWANMKDKEWDIHFQLRDGKKLHSDRKRITDFPTYKEQDGKLKIKNILSNFE